MRSQEDPESFVVEGGHPCSWKESHASPIHVHWPPTTKSHQPECEEMALSAGGLRHTHRATATVYIRAIGVGEPKCFGESSGRKGIASLLSDHGSFDERGVELSLGRW